MVSSNRPPLVTKSLELAALVDLRPPGREPTGVGSRHRPLNPRAAFAFWLLDLDQLATAPRIHAHAEWLGSIGFTHFPLPPRLRWLAARSAFYCLRCSSVPGRVR